MNSRLDHGAGGSRDCPVVTQEDGTGGESLGKREAEFLAHLTQKTKRKLDQQAATVAGLAIRRDGATMGQARQRRDRSFHYEVARYIVQVCDQPEAAAVVLECRVV